MPKYSLPPGWPDPYDLLRDVDYEQHYPHLLLRGIYNVMERSNSANYEYWFRAGFNFVVKRLATAKPPRYVLSTLLEGDAGLNALSTRGVRQNAEVTGATKLSQESVRKYGKKSPTQMEMDTKKKLKKLAQWINIIRATSEEPGMPNARVIEQGGGS